MLVRPSNLSRSGTRSSASAKRRRRIGSEVSSAIIGASSVGQIEENAAAPDVVIPADVLKQLDEIFAAPVQTYPG